MTGLYDQDFHAWALSQAAALRRAAELRINLPDVDIEHLAEEIEDMGRGQAHAVESALARIIEHLLKLQYSPSPLPRRGWRRSVAEQRTQLDRRLRKNPGLRRREILSEMLEGAWRDGRRLAVMGLETYGEQVAAALPADCPYSFEQLCDFDWQPANSHFTNGARPGMTDRLMDEIVDFWFDDACKPYWFNSRPTFDRLVQDNLLEHHLKAAAGEFDPWLEDVDGTLALCILLDQAPRNCFRGTAQAFATDPQARAAAAHALREGYDLECTEDERMFFYLPFMHHEDPDSQALAVRLFAERCPRPEAVAAAARHQEIISRFGRFPHRNIALGRVTTEEEETFLREPGSSF